MLIAEPDNALQCYEKALNEFPEDTTLVSRKGQALIHCHYLSKAINYYKDAIQIKNDIQLKLKLAELYMNSKQYDKGEIILLNYLEQETDNLDDLAYIQSKTELLLLLSEIQERSGNLDHALTSLKDAMDNQGRVRRKIEMEGNGKFCPKLRGNSRCQSNLKY